MFQRVQRQPRMYEDVARQIEKAILLNHRRPGDQLPPERELIEHFAVSRAVIRESLKVLSEKGLIEIIPGKGAFVRHPEEGAVRDALQLYLRRQRDEKFAGSLTEVRQILEGETAALAAGRATGEDIKRLEASVTEMEAHVDSLEKFAEADLQFHQALAAATHNELMALLLNPVTGLLTDIMMQLSPLPKAREEAIKHHRAILRAIKRHDGDSARRAMREHLSQFERRFKEYLTRKEAPLNPMTTSHDPAASGVGLIKTKKS